uniref:Uncharacterized protein n=1 Tax=uncultured marine virus TaxID=186617 RepID=A0A0F7L8W2_9VIRU|nr:hypothetical protein [uncultured marine virus]
MSSLRSLGIDDSALLNPSPAALAPKGQLKKVFIHLNAFPPVVVSSTPQIRGSKASIGAPFIDSV